MAEALANVIPLSPTRVKLNFINWDGPSLTGLTTITYDSTSYDVVDDGRAGCSWIVVDATYSDFGQSRVIIEADFPDPSPSEPALGYGLLYNWYAATDARGVAPSGFRVTTTTDWSDLQTSNQAEFLGQNTEIPDPYWAFLNAASNNNTELTLYGAGLRQSSGGYSSFRSEAVITTSTEIAPTAYDAWRISGGALTGGTSSQLKTFAGVIRCVSDTEPSTVLVQDNDGNNYSWVQIGSQYWLKQSLKTTTYNNGDAIPTGLDNTAWSNTTDGAYAFPNNDPSLPI